MAQADFFTHFGRFFQSQPKTVRSDESAGCGKMETAKSANRSSDSDSKSSPNIDYSSGSNARFVRFANNLFYLYISYFLIDAKIVMILLHETIIVCTDYQVKAMRTSVANGIALVR